MLANVDLVLRHQRGGAEFCRFGLAGVSPDDVNIIWGLAPHLHHD